MSAATPTATLPDLITLLKPRVMSLVVFAGAAGMVIAPNDIHPLIAVLVLVAIAINAGAAASINMWYDRDIDAVMTRTQTRPLPQGRMVSATALEYGVVLTVLSVLLLGLATNWVAAAFLLAANLFYVFIYTIWLKRRTPQNIVIGGAAGAFPPIIGWAAVMGDIAWPPIVLFLLIFLWTPPHFWALALYKSDDYGRAGVPMLPNVAGAKSTKWQMLVYTLLLAPVALAPYFMGFGGTAYAATAAVLSTLFIICAARVMQADENEHKPAKQMFGFSILYLFALLGALMLERL